MTTHLSMTKLFSLIAEQSGQVAADDIKLNMTMDDLGLDSLNHLELVMAIEEEMSIEIPDEAAERIIGYGPGSTVQGILDYITTR